MHIDKLNITNKKYNMFKCAYIILISNNEKNIPTLVNSLKNLSGNFRKEFIFIDDGSTDNSLQILKSEITKLPRTTIITQQKQGSSVSINKALGLITTDYVHFVEGDEELYPDSTELLVSSTLKLGTQVAIGVISNKPKKSENEYVTLGLVENPIKEILDKKLPFTQNVGKSGSLVHGELLKKIGTIDTSIYTQNMSLSLACAKYTKFAYLKQDVTRVPKLENTQDHNLDRKFYAYNNLKSIYNFVKTNPDLFTELIPSLFKALSRNAAQQSGKVNYSSKYVFSKYIKSQNIGKVLKYYEKELNQLF